MGREDSQNFDRADAMRDPQNFVGINMAFLRP